MMKYFKDSEFECPHCKKIEMNQEFLQRLDSIRGYLRFPFIISSGYRCQEYNKSIGAKPTSGHVLGRAVDIAIIGEDAYEIITYAKSYGFTGIGTSQKGRHRFIHLDDLNGSIEQPRPWLWSY